MIRYDRKLRRLWIKGQRWHHGTTGVVLAATGVLLMAHDWKDRSLWFVRGWQDQPYSPRPRAGRVLGGPRR